MQHKEQKTNLTTIVMIILSLALAITTVFAILSFIKTNSASSQIDAMMQRIEDLEGSKFRDDFNTAPFLGLILDMNGDNSTTVIGVTPYSPAALAGFEVGDMVISINYEPIESYDDLMEFMSKVNVGDTLNFTVSRTTVSGKVVTQILTANPTYAGNLL